MPKKKKPSHVGDPFEGKGGTNNNNDHPSQRRRVNTAGDRETRAGGVAVNSDGKSISVIGISGNRNHRSSGHSFGQSSGRANFEKLFPSSSDEEDAGNEVEDGGEEEWEVPTTTVAVAAAASRPQRGNVVNYSYKAYHKESQKQFKVPSFNRFSVLADDDEEEDASVDERKMPASVKHDNVSEDDTDSNPSEDDSDEFETGDVSEESSLDADSTESEEEERGGDISSCGSDMMTKKKKTKKKKKKKKTGSKRNGNGNQRSKKSKTAKGKTKKDKAESVCRHLCSICVCVSFSLFDSVLTAVFLYSLLPSSTQTSGGTPMTMAIPTVALPMYKRQKPQQGIQLIACRRF